MGTLDLPGRIRDMATRLRVDPEQQRHEIVESRAIQGMIKTKLVSSL